MNVSLKHSTNSTGTNKKSYFSYFSSNFRVAITILLVFLAIMFYIFFFKSSRYCVLYNGLSSEDERLIVSQLARINIPFKSDDNHSIVLVPENKLQEARINLFEQGIPKGNSIGFELLDQEKFGISQFNEQINYQRALEGELARSIQQLDNIKTARVHIAFPKPSLFIQDKKLTSASIILGIKKNLNINSSQISAILHMVSGSISGLSVDNITIIDQKGKLLNSNDSFDNNVDDIKLKYYDLVEDHYKQRIENILIPLVGLNNVHAQVTAQINFDRRESMEEKYKPNYRNDSKSIRSHQGNSNVEVNERHLNDYVSSNNFSNKLNVLSNKLSSNNVLDKQIDRSLMLPKSNTTQDYITNYELDRTILHSKLQIGDIKRLSVAVVINYIRDKNGDLVSLSPYQINKIENLIRAVIGFSAERGDTVSVVSSLFVKPFFNVYKNVSFWNESLFFNKLFKYGLISIFLIMVYIFYRAFFSKNTIKDDKLKHVSKNNDGETFNTIKNCLKNVAIDKGFSDLSKNDPHVIATIIRRWMDDDKK
ncbi:MAG: flagellar basal-body MS-ring/collar protein FliF [Buchnera aphidicola (Meitanaphis microgallis)]